MRRKPSIKSLRNKLDRVFSEYIRGRDAGKPCITCGKMVPLQCGHFIKRQHLATRWDERNCAGQCVRCNLYLGGAQDEFAAAIVQKYGVSVLAQLLAKKHVTVKMTRSDYETMISKYSILPAALDSPDRP